MLQENGRDTKLLPGDELHFDVDNHNVKFLRQGRPLLQANGDDCYYVMPSDGVEFTALAELIADAAGLHVEKVEGDDLHYVFRST